MFDPLTFTIATGNDDDRRLGYETLDAIELIAKELPDCQIILGLSNISFGLNPPARHVLNSVYLDHALKRGLTGAIDLMTAARAQGFATMLGCMVGTSLAMAPAMLLAGQADFVDLDGPLLLARDRTPGLIYDGSIVRPPLRELWG